MVVSLFAPLPLAIMIPFMAAQSAAIGEAFGKHYQYGKRRISAMSNEDFNKLDSHELFEQSMQSIRESVPSMMRAMNQSADLQVDIINILADTVHKVIESIPELAEKVIFGGDDTETKSSTGISNPFVASFLTPLIMEANKLQQLADLAAKNNVTTTQTTVEEFNKKIAEIAASIPKEVLSPSFVGPPSKTQITVPPQQPNTLRVDPITGILTNLDTRAPRVLPPKQSTVTSTPRKAGQSQILEKANLERMLVREERLLVAYKKSYSQSSGANRTSLGNLVNTFTKAIKNHKQSLANLLARYNF